MRSWISDHLQSGGLALSGDSQSNLIISWDRQWTTRTVIGVKRTGNLNRVLITQVPNVTIHASLSRNSLGFRHPVRPLFRLRIPFLFAAPKPANQVFIAIQGLQNNFIARLLLVVIITHRSARSVFSGRLLSFNLVSVM